jgi:lipid-binding SYLF domain-containing protein
VTDGSRPGMIVKPQEDTTWSEPSAAQATMSKAGRTKGDMAEVSVEVIVMEQGPVSALSTPFATVEIVSVEVSQQEGPAVPGSGEESPRALA